MGAKQRRFWGRRIPAGPKATVAVALMLGLASDALVHATRPGPRTTARATPEPSPVEGLPPDLSDILTMEAKGRGAGSQQKRYTRRRRELEGADYIQDSRT
jgi:hypothetical protein